MLKELFERQRRYIEDFFKRIDHAQAETVLKTFLECRGLIVFTGIGKSGIIAEKIAMTLTSTGTKALYLAPTNFLHGDIGILGPEDLFVVISKSGETEELLDLMPFIKRRNVKLISIVSNPNSRLSKVSDLSICLPVQKELCPFDLAPTTSTAIQLIFGDVLAVALMQQKQFSLEDYILTHPAGAIGKKMTLTVEDLMLKGEQVPMSKKEDKLSDAILELSNKRCGCLLIVDANTHLQGIFTDGDLRRALQSQGSQIMEKTLGELMTSTAICVERSALAWDVLKMMQKDPKRWVMVCPVLQDHQVIGLVRMHDIIQAGLA